MKAVRLFLRDHLSFLLFQGVLVLFLLTLFWLDGFRNVNTTIYAIVISLFLTFGFLTAKFIMRRSFYLAITVPPKQMENALIRHAHGPEHIATAAFTRKLYRLYQDEVQTLYGSQSRQNQFVNSWVHQMKTPISVMNLLLLEEGELDRDSMREEVTRIQSGLDLVLVNARLETFERDMTIERENLKKLVQEVITEHKRLFITNGVFPVLSINDAFVVATDVKWLKIVITQFVTNAVKYTFETGKKIYITAENEERGILLTVRDEGIGIPATDLNRIQKAFFTGENGRLTGESTGVGLYIATEVCEKLGHDLAIESASSEGTTVKVLFKNGGTEVEHGSGNHRGDAGSNENI